jgi:hypothetical protein
MAQQTIEQALALCGRGKMIALVSSENFIMKANNLERSYSHFKKHTDLTILLPTKPSLFTVASIYRQQPWSSGILSNLYWMIIDHQGYPH